MNQVKETRDLVDITTHLPEALGVMLVILMQRSGESQITFTEPEMEAAAAICDAGKVKAHFMHEPAGNRVEALIIEILE